MSLERLTFSDRDSWLAGRGSGIGGSDAAAVVGLSPWQTPIGLWKQKTGTEVAKDISENVAVQQGVRMESAIRGFFQSSHPEFTIEYHQFDILYQSERPWIRATLDGEIITESGQRGILEIKTSTPSGKMGWSKWADGHIPPNYLTQLVHQLLATGYDFAFLFAALYCANGDVMLREYQIDRSDISDDLIWLRDKEDEFWRCVQERTVPPMTLTI